MFICTMKTKKTLYRPFHLHVEYFFRKQYCIFAVMALLGIAIAKSDGKMLGVMRDAYARGFSVINEYMREETTRTPLTVVVARYTPSSGQ